MKLMLSFLYVLFFLNFKTEHSNKASILIGVVNSSNSEQIDFNNIKNSIINEYTNSIEKIEYCNNHSLIFIKFKLEIFSDINEQVLINKLEMNFKNYDFYIKNLNENINELNCKWL